MKDVIKRVENVRGRIRELNDLFTKLGPTFFESLTTEEQGAIDASLEGQDSLDDIVGILEGLRNVMAEEGGEDSEDDR